MERAGLPPVAIPDRTRRPEVQAFAPRGLRSSLVIDADHEVVAKWKAEAFGANIAVAGHVTGNPRLRRPGCAAVGGTAVIHIPQRIVARIHPSDSHIAGVSGCERRKGM